MLFGKKSVDSIMSKLHNTIEELEAHAEVQKVKAAAERTYAAIALEAQKAYETEHALATKVASNIKALLT